MNEQQQQQPELSAGQVLQMQIFEQQVMGMSQEQAQRALIRLRELYMAQEVEYKAKIAQAWGIPP